jgi:hypothetical protein
LLCASQAPSSELFFLFESWVIALDPVKKLVVPNDVVGGLQDPMILIGVPQQARVYTLGFECVVVG